MNVLQAMGLGLLKKPSQKEKRGKEGGANALFNMFLWFVFLFI